MRNSPRFWALGGSLFTVLLLSASCALVEDVLPPAPTPAPRMVAMPTTTATPTTSTVPPTTTATPTTTTEEPFDPVAVLTANYRWGHSDETYLLQQLLQVTVDGWYGPQTRAAHLRFLEVEGLSTAGVPPVPPPPVVVPEVDPDAPELELECQEMACWPGYTGDYQAAVVAAVTGVPSVLLSGLVGVQIVNGCWPGAAHFDLPDDCSVNVYDEWGWYADGSPGNPWANSIWITNSTAAGPGLAYVALHEVAHAYSMQVLDVCYDPDGTSYQTRLYALMDEPQFAGTNPEELLADVIAGYFGHPYTNYRGDAQVSEAQSVLLTEAFAACS